MNRKNKHINSVLGKIPRILLKTTMVLGLVYMFVQSGPVKAQVINNNGAAISVTSGTVFQGDTMQTSGTVINNGIIGLRGHYINSGTTEGTGIYNLAGNWINTGTFNSNTSTVRFNGNSFQLITSNGDPFYKLVVSNTGTGVANRIILSDNVNVSDSLNLINGNIETGANILYLENQSPLALTYTSTTGSRVIGKFERGIGAPSYYLFPIGSEDNYNPMNLNFNSVDNPGSILSEFVASDPDSIGLPLADPGYLNPADSVEVYDADSIGYWSVTANNSFVSSNFDVNLDGTGFTIPNQNVTRIIKRPDSGDWMLDGKHQDANGTIAYRNTLIGGVAGTGHHFGWGHIRPRIQTQPEDTAICDGENATFSIVATGRGTLNYEWEVLEGSGGWQTITDNGTYANSATDTLLIIAADTSMNGYKYRVIVTDSLGNFHRSNSQATLTVSPRPVVTATPQNDTICNGSTTFIDLNSTVPGTTFTLEVLYSGSITGTGTTLVGDTTIRQTLTNPTLDADSVVYRIFPTGPTYPYCGGTADTVVIWVEPTVYINAVSDTICDGTETNIIVNTNNTTTNGIYYTWTATATDSDVSGYTSNASGQDVSVNLIETLDNTGLDSAIVHYTITPWTLDASGNLKCEGIPIQIDIWVEPTVEIIAAHDTLCDGDATNIVVSSPNTTTNGIRYTWTVTDNPDINGESNSVGNGQFENDTIIQNLINTSYSKQLVQYTITPWTVNANNENECTDASKIITVDIWVDPTPRVFSTIEKDTICNDERISIKLTTPNIMTVGNVTFDYISMADAGLTGNTNDVNRNDSFVITDSLHNSTAGPATPQVVRYTITPRALLTGCSDGPSITDSITVHPTADTYMSSDSVRCYLESNGKATVLAENGIGIFTYQWDDASTQTNPTSTGLVERMYRVTVTDNQSCTKTDSVWVGQPDLLVAVIDSIKPVSCSGSGDGFVVMDPVGGNYQYSYNWSTSETSDSIGSLDGGRYYVTVTDWKGCYDETSMVVNEPPQVIQNLEIHDVTCNGENNGWIKADVLGINTYLWNTGETTQTIDSLEPGYYTVEITSAEGCFSIAGGTVEEPDVLKIDSIVSTNISCAGDADGTLDLFVSGGNTEIDYTYSWSTTNGVGLVPNIQDQSSLSGGDYYITVTDWRGCTTNDSAVVNEPPIYTSSIAYNDVTCFGYEDGNASLTVNGGNGDYVYNWSNGAEEDSIFDLLPGTYYATITDAKGCELYNTAIINEPDELIAIVTGTHISCNSYADGTAVVDITGGNGGYQIVWDPTGETTDSIYGLVADTYYANITDAKGCVAVDYAEILEPDPIENNLLSENVTCFGYNNGEIVVTPEGGTIPYTYFWSHSAAYSDSLANDLIAGEYSVSVVDMNNCMEVSNVTITQPDELLFENFVKTDITCNGDDDGSISFTLTGGTPEHTIEWSNGLDQTAGYDLTFGTYNIHVFDIHDCLLDTSVTIVEPDMLTISPNTRKPTCSDIQDGFIELNINGGRLPYDITWDDGVRDENLYDIRSGIYDVIVTDSSGCQADSSFVIRSEFTTCIDIPSAFSPNGDNINEKWEIDMRGLYPQVEVEIFDRWGKRVFYSKGYEESQYWDGILNGKRLPMDAYYYIIYLHNGARRISGTVTLLR